MQDIIWRDCIEPQKRHNAFNILNQYLWNYEMCQNGQFSKIQSHIAYYILREFLALCTDITDGYIHVHYVQ